MTSIADEVSLEDEALYGMVIQGLSYLNCVITTT